MAIDIKGLSRRELETLKTKIEKALEKMSKADMDKALKAAEAAAKEHGFSLSELTGGAAPAPARRGRPPKSAAKPKAKPAKTSKPKYAKPGEPSVTWTGKGRRPDWIKEGLAAGKSLADFAIK